MSNNEMNAFLSAGSPPGVKLSGLEYGLYLHICHRYDTRADIRSAYPGMDEFRRASTMSRSAIECALAKLKDKGLITQVKKGYIGSRAEYVPSYSLHLLTNRESVAYSNTLDNEVSSTPAESVSNTGIESPAYAHRVSSTPVAISTVSTVNTNKYNSLRFKVWVDFTKDEKERIEALERKRAEKQKRREERKGSSDSSDDSEDDGLDNRVKKSICLKMDSLSEDLLAYFRVTLS